MLTDPLDMPDEGTPILMGTPNEIMVELAQMQQTRAMRTRVADQVIETMRAHRCTVDAAITHLREGLVGAMQRDPRPTDEAYMADVFEPGCELARQDVEFAKELTSLEESGLQIVTECTEESSSEGGEG